MLFTYDTVLIFETLQLKMPPLHVFFIVPSENHNGRERAFSNEHKFLEMMFNLRQGMLRSFSSTRRTFFPSTSSTLSSSSSSTVDDNLLFDFSDRRVPQSWISGSDLEVGGESTCSFCWNGETGGGTYAVFSGKIGSDHSGKAVRTGYCAVRSPTPQVPLNLEHFESLECKIRSDLRMYSLNIISDAWIKTDLHQGFFFVDSSDWVTIEIPFRNLVLIEKGKPSIFQRSLDSRNVLTFGISVSDSIPGPFRLEIEYIKAKQKRSADADILKRSFLSPDEKALEKLRKKLC